MTEILMSTYNGEKFLREQLDSILAQTARVKLSVRDDGSSDGTCCILKEYENKYGVGVVYGSNIGVNASMMELLKNADPSCEYYAFSDQDDVWAANKIELAEKWLGSVDSGISALWGCMEELVNEDLKMISKMPEPRYLGDFYAAMIQNRMGGHTQVFNKALRDKLLRVPPGKMYVYDWVAYILASMFGTVCFERTVCGKYRQHRDNAIGYELSELAQIPRRLKRLFSGAFGRIAFQMDSIDEIFRGEMKSKHKKELGRFLAANRSFSKRIGYAFTTRFKRDNWLESLEFRLLYAAGAYKIREEKHGNRK